MDGFLIVAIVGLAVCLALSLAFNFHQRQLYDWAMSNWRRASALHDHTKREVSDLRSQLAQASKNDHRDAKGKFTKAKA